MSMTAPPVRSERLNSADHAGNGCRREANPVRGFPGSPTRLAGDLDVLGPEAQDVRDHEDAIGCLVGPDERLGIFEREGDRLLEEDVLASGERGLGHLPVLRVGRQISIRLDAGVGENRLQIVRPTRADLARQGRRDRDLGRRSPPPRRQASRRTLSRACSHEPAPKTATWTIALSPTLLSVSYRLLAILLACRLTVFPSH